MTMNKLYFKTRGMENPQGKPKVFFCAHLKDQEMCFDTIANEILLRQDCAIYYLKSEECDEQLKFDISQMQLFVIPVTYQFLHDNNEARITWQEIATKNHIPILYIMLETGLDRDFNRICGERHFLDKTDTDETSITYEEKLTKFLASALIGDDLIQKIKAAFDVCVFLSYRKKDRIFAQELMRLIHQNKMCRDIAIWYDEFLVPGENFNASISDAIEMCNLFALVVTPNLVNEDNYVMAIEYPLAKKEGKPILVTEMAETNRSDLETSYPGIPLCIDPRDATALLEAIKTIKPSETDDSPNHIFFVGLAYLSGTCVEKNALRAVELITTAAEQGLSEAMEKLASMFEIGDGVSVDLCKAIYWQRKLIEYYEAEYKNSKTKEHATRWFRALQECFELSLKNGNVEDIRECAKNYYEATLEIYEYENTDFDEIVEFYYLDSTMKNAFVSEMVGDLQDAGTTYNAMIASIEDYEEEYHTHEGIVLLANCCYRLGEVYRKGDNTEKAIESLKDATKYYQKIENEYLGAKRNLSKCYIALSQATIKQQHFLIAIKWCKKALDVLEELSCKNPDVSYDVDFCEVYLCLGEASKGANEYENAKNLYQKAVNFAEKAVGRAPTDINCLLLGKSYKMFGELYFSQQKYKPAEEFLSKAVKIYESANKQVRTIFENRDIADMYKQIAYSLEEQNEYITANVYRKKEITLREAIVEEGIVVDTSWDVIFKVAEGELAADNASDIIAKERRVDPEDREKLSDSYIAAGDNAQKRGVAKDAKWRYNKALTIREVLHAEYSTAYTAAIFSEICTKVGAIEQDTENVKAACEAFKKGVEALEKIIAEGNADNLRVNLMRAYLDLGDAIVEDKNDVRVIVTYYEKCLAFCAKMYSSEDTESAVTVKAFFCYQYCRDLVNVLCKTNEYKSAKNWIKKAIEYYEFAYPRAKSKKTRKELEEAYTTAIEISQKCGDLLSAIGYKRKRKNLL